MRNVISLATVGLLAGCAATMTDPGAYNSVRDFALEDARANVPVLDRFALYPEPATFRELEELRFETGSYGEQLIQRLADYCVASGLNPITDTNDLFGTQRPPGWLDGINAMARYSNKTVTLDDDLRTLKQLGRGVGFVACSNNKLDIRQVQTDRHDVAWYAFFVGRGEYNSITTSSYTGHYFLFLERRLGVDSGAFDKAVTDRLLAYHPKTVTLE